MVVHVLNGKGYRLYDQSTRTVFTAHDVIFEEVARLDVQDVYDTIEYEHEHEHDD